MIVTVDWFLSHLTRNVKITLFPCFHSHVSIFFAGYRLGRDWDLVVIQIFTKRILKFKAEYSVPGVFFLYLFCCFPGNIELVEM